MLQEKNHYIDYLEYVIADVILHWVKKLEGNYNAQPSSGRFELYPFMISNGFKNPRFLQTIISEVNRQMIFETIFKDAIKSITIDCCKLQNC